MTNKKRPNSEKNKEHRERERENDFVFTFDISAQYYICILRHVTFERCATRQLYSGREIYTLNPKIKQFCDS